MIYVREESTCVNEPRWPHRSLAADDAMTVITSLGESVTMTRAVHVHYAVEQDEDGVWCAHAQLRPGVGASGEGDSAQAAVADLREALTVLIAELGSATG